MARQLFRLDVRVTKRSQAATIGNLRQYGRGVTKDLQAITQRSGTRAHGIASRLAPRDTSYMVEHLRLVITAKRFGWQIGYDEADFIGRGLAFYPVFQELGFRHWLSGEFIQNPHLAPAHRLEAPRYENEVRAALRRNVLKLRARAQ